VSLQIPVETGLLLLGASLAIAMLGIRLLVSSWIKQDSVARRTALDDAERRAATWRARINARIRHTGVGNSLETQLLSAGVELRPIDFLLIAAVVFFIGAAVTNAVLPLWMALLAGLACTRLCWVWLNRKRLRRREKFIAQLPDIARLLSNASSAGLAMRTAIGMAAGELDDPAGTELRLVSEELAVGQTTEGALSNLERRMPSRDVGVLVSTLVIQQRAGGDIVSALAEMARTLEKRKELRREVRSILAGSVFTGYLVAGMGMFAVIILNSIKGGVIERMASQPLGQTVLLAAGALYAFAFFLIRKSTEIDV
jgi:tight adherence protein B